MAFPTKFCVVAHTYTSTKFISTDQVILTQADILAESIKRPS